ALLETAASGKDTALTPRDVHDDATREVRLGQDFTITIEPDPESVDLEELDEETGLATPKPVMWTITVENTSGSELVHPRITLNPVLRDNSGRNPSALFPLELTAWRVDDADEPTAVDVDNRAEVPLGIQADPLVPTRTMAAGATQTIKLGSQAVEEGIIDLQ